MMTDRLSISDDEFLTRMLTRRPFIADEFQSAVHNYVTKDLSRARFHATKFNAVRVDGYVVIAAGDDQIGYGLVLLPS